MRKANLSRLLQAEISEDPEVVGQRIRDILGVTDELQNHWRDADGRTGFNAWRSRIEATGTFVFQTARPLRVKKRQALRYLPIYRRLSLSIGRTR
jgi:hypothetical protein